MKTLSDTDTVSEIEKQLKLVKLDHSVKCISCTRIIETGSDCYELDNINIYYICNCCKHKIDC